VAAAPRSLRPILTAIYLGAQMSVYKVIDIIGTSNVSWEDAAAEAVRTASATIRDLRVGEVVKQDIHLEEGGTLTYRIRLQVSFKYEGSG
jgi:flavin-binding protein dodecin